MKGLVRGSLVALFFALTSCTGSEGGTDQPECTDLIAGQTIVVGSVCAEVTDTTIEVTYTTTGDWYLYEAQLGWGLESTDVTQPDGSALPPGQLEYNAGDIAYTQSYTFSAPLDDLPDIPCPEKVYLAAHASVALIVDDEVVQTETGWAYGTPYTGNRWGWYWEIDVPCEPDTPDEEEERTCETAFAYGDNTFIDLGLTNGRWGWEIGPVSEGNYVTELYAGAGRNDISKGTYVGDLVYSYLGGELVVYFEANAGFGFDETHLYADYLPTDTIAPGQFGNLNEELDNASSDSYTLYFDGTEIYLVAHAVACWEE